MKFSQLKRIDHLARSIYYYCCSCYHCYFQSQLWIFFYLIFFTFARCFNLINSNQFQIPLVKKSTILLFVQTLIFTFIVIIGRRTKQILPRNYFTENEIKNCETPMNLCMCMCVHTMSIVTQNTMTHARKQSSISDKRCQCKWVVANKEFRNF